MAVTAAPANYHSAWVSFDVNTARPTGDQTTWEGTPGSSLTLRFRWQAGGTGSGTGAASAPNFANVRATLPGGGSFSDWVVAFPAANTEVTRTFHFDSLPMDQSAGSARAGMIEIFMDWGNTGGLTPWSIDSRGGQTGGVLPTDTLSWARGYARAPNTLSSYSISNVAVAGAEPSSWATPDPIHQRFTLGTTWYESTTHTARIRSSSSASVERSQSNSGVGPNVDRSWTSTTAGQTATIGNGMVLASETKDIELAITAEDFGGDNEKVWATTGHASGFAVSGDRLTLTDEDRITVDPRFLGNPPAGTPAGSVLFHTQLVGDEFLDPPSSGDVTSGQRAFPFVGYFSVRYTNARSEGVNSLVTTLKYWDSDNILGTESSPVGTFSGTTATRRDPPPTVVTPQVGWLPKAASGADENVLPITWSEVAAGTWRVKSVVTSPSAYTGLEQYAQSAAGDTWNRNVFFVTVNPNYAPIISIHPENITHHGTHLTPEDDLIPVVYLFDQSTAMFVELVEANGDNVSIHITREHHPTMRADSFDFVLEEWVAKADGGTVEDSLALVRGNVHSVGGDPDIWTAASHLGGEIFAPDGVAGELDAMIIADIVKDGVHYSAFAPVILVGKLNKHNLQAFDPLGLYK